MIDAREYLQFFRDIGARIRMKENQLQDIRDRLSNISPQMDGELVSHTRNVGVMGDRIAILVDMREELEQQVADLYCREQEAYRLLDQISPEGAGILTEYYFKRKSLTECGMVYHIAKRQAQRRLNEAIAEFQTVLSKSGV